VGISNSWKGRSFGILNAGTVCIQLSHNYFSFE
jgi:hypothetical protein